MSNFFQTKRFRAFLLSILLALVIEIVFQGLSFLSLNGLDTFFWLVASLGFLVLVIELLASWYLAHKKRIEIEMPKFSSKSWREHLVNHAILPSSLYALTVLFIWDNQIPIFVEIVSGFIAIIFIPLFINLYATYRNQFKIRNETFYVFDFVRIIIFFLLVNMIVDWTGKFEFFTVMLTKSLVVALATYVIIFLMVWLSKQVSIITQAFMILSSLLMGIVFFVFIGFFFTINSLVISVIVTLAFFLVNTYWHHKLDGTFTAYLFSEYILIVILCSILLISLGA